jgi:hypothetical protein
MLQEMVNQVKEVYSHLQGAQAAIFSFWLFCVAGFCAIAGYLVYLGAETLFKRIFHRNRF